MNSNILSCIIVDGFKLNYAIKGSGYPTIVIGSSIYYPRVFSVDLGKELRLIFMDHRGFGEATKNVKQSDFELEKLIDDIEVLRKHLGIEVWHVVGHSGHGYIALEYAKKYSEHVSRVILVALSPDGTSQSFAAADQYLQDSVCPERKALLTKNMEQLPFDIQKDPTRRFIWYSLRSGPRIWFDYTYDASSLWEDIQVIPEMFDYVWGIVFKNLDITRDIEKLNIPVFLVLGRYDYWNPPHLWNSVRTQFKDLTVCVFEKSGHTPQLEQPDNFNRELLRWLKK